MLVRSTVAFFAALILAGPAGSQQAEDAGAMVPQFQEGDVVTFDQIDKLKPYLPQQFWDNRDFFFYEGMQLEIGPTQYDYSEADEFKAATERFKGQARIGPDNSLENYVAGRPFESEEIDCLGDPQAGVKWMWNFDYRWDGDGARASFYYSYWDRGEQLPLYYQGSAKTVKLSSRIEAEFLE